VRRTCGKGCRSKASDVMGSNDIVQARQHIVRRPRVRLYAHWAAIWSLWPR
jgi:hypothetical protein